MPLFFTFRFLFPTYIIYICGKRRRLGVNIWKVPTILLKTNPYTFWFLYLKEAFSFDQLTPWQSHNAHKVKLFVTWNFAGYKITLFWKIVGCLEFLEVFLHESKTNLTKPASELKILIMINTKAHVYRELHYIHIALLFSRNIQMFYLKKNVGLSFYFLFIRESLEKERVCDSVNKLFSATHYSVHQLSAGEAC